MVSVLKRSNRVLFVMQGLFSLLGVVLSMHLRPLLIPATTAVPESELIFKSLLYTVVLLIAIFLNDLFHIQVVINKRILLPRLAKAIIVALLLYALVTAIFPDVAQGRFVIVSSVAFMAVFHIILYKVSSRCMEHPAFLERALVLGEGRLARKLRQELRSGFYRQRLVDDPGVEAHVMEVLYLAGEGNPAAREQLRQLQEDVDLVVLAFDNLRWLERDRKQERFHYEPLVKRAEGQVIRMHRHARGQVKLPFTRVRRPHARIGANTFHYPAESILRGLVALKLTNIKVIRGTDYHEQMTGRVYMGVPADQLFFSKPAFKLDKVSLLAKFVWEWMLAAVIFLCVIPFQILVPIAILIDTGRPLLFIQPRVGKGGKVYKLYKWRSMDDKGNITRVGRIIRKTKLDEFPQLINVLRGEMALVGPRPEIPNFVDEFHESDPYYNLRHMVRPGLTGWAQVMFPDATATDAIKKLSYDLYYVKNFSLAFDMVIMAETFKMIVFGGVARLARLAVPVTTLGGAMDPYEPTDPGFPSTDPGFPSSDPGFPLGNLGRSSTRR